MPVQNNNFINISDFQDSRNDELWKEFISSVVFIKPALLPQSAWTEHIPFAFWLINSLKPDLFVELGTHYGLSYFSFCQAIQKSQLQTKCYAIDNWIGDEHAGYYDDAVFEFVNKINEPYNSFSTLYRSTFDDAVSSFKDKSIDLLHIDGLHTYEAVKHDFYNWLPKISKTGVVVFHDTNVRERGFGVYKLWEELIKEYPHFDFNHGFGLGILGVGEKIPEKIEQLFNIGSIPAIRTAIRNVYERLGNLSKIEQECYRTIVKPNPEKETEEKTESQLTENKALIGSLPGSTGNNKGPETYLHPLQTICTQVFWKKQGEEFNEANSEIQTVQLTNSKSLYLFKLNQGFSSLKKLRIDPATEQGIFYLHSISIANESGKILLNWEAIKEMSVFYNLAIFKSSLLENTFVFIAITNDPIIEIEVPALSHFSEIDNINLIIAFSAVDNDSLNKELSNITINELKAEQTHNAIQIHNTFFENLQSAKKEIDTAISHYANDVLSELKKDYLVLQQKLEQDKNDLIAELKGLRMILDKHIKESALTIEKKEETIGDLVKKLEEIKVGEAALKEHFLQKSFEAKSLTMAYENSQKEFAVLEARSKNDLYIVQSRMEELLKELENKKSIIEANEKEFILREQNMQVMQNKIAGYEEHYDNNSLFGIIKDRLRNAKNK